VSGVGAVTWGDGAMGIKGRRIQRITVWSAPHVDDYVGFRSVTVLNNSNYVGMHPNWQTGPPPALAPGAATWGAA